VEVAPERVAGWFTRFADRHGGVTRTVTASGQVRVESADAVATLTVPFGQLPDAVATGLAVDPLVAHLLLPRRIGLLLVRIGGHSVGIAYHGRIEVSRTDRRLVQGRTAAGGWSQQRFARRRAGQARQALHAAATDAFEVLAPALSTMDAIFLGGDSRALDELRTDRRLESLFARAEPRILEIPEPRRTVLEDAAQRARAVEITVR
jgi:hypothetical protein